MKDAHRYAAIYTWIFFAGLLLMNLISDSFALSPGKTYRPVARGRHWALSTRNPLATQAGVRIFQAGGNAIDASIAAQAALGVVEPTMSGIGGESFFLIHDPDAPHKVRCINGGGTAPAKATIEWFQKNKHEYIPNVGILAGVVPGTVDAWVITLDLYGTMSLGEVLAPAIELAEDGFPASDNFSGWLEGASQVLKIFESSQRLYLKQGGDIYKPGEIYRNPDLARTMKRLVDAEKRMKSQGRSRALKAARDEFYRGSIARDFVLYSESHDGLFSMEDFANYHALIEEPVWIRYGDYTIFKPASNNQGPAELMALNIINGLPLKSWQWYSAPFIHHLAEAVNLAMADRELYVGDLNFVKTPLNGLLADGFAAERRKLISPYSRLQEYPDGNPYPFEKPQYTYSPKRNSFAGGMEPHPIMQDRLEFTAKKRSGLSGSSAENLLGWKTGDRTGHTSYACAADAQGNVISATPSLYQSYGGKEVIGDLGFPLNNRLTYFHLDAEHANGLMPGKRPRNTITPSMALKNDKPFLAYGTPGGDQQCQALMQFFVNVVEFGKNVQEALDAPIFQSFSFPGSYSPFPVEEGVISLDERTDAHVLSELRRMGWKVRIVPNFTNNDGSAILIDPETGAFAAGAISSKENMAAAW